MPARTQSIFHNTGGFREPLMKSFASAVVDRLDDMEGYGDPDRRAVRVFDLADMKKELARLATTTNIISNNYVNKQEIIQPQGAQVITEDTTIYVGATRRYTSITQALEYLANFAISRNATVTIKLDDGIYNHPYVLYLYHPYGERIQIIGNQSTPTNCKLTFEDTGVWISNGTTIGLIDGFWMLGPADPGDKGTSSSDVFGETCGIRVQKAASATVGSAMIIDSFYSGIAAIWSGVVTVYGAHITNSTYFGTASAYSGVVHLLSGGLCDYNGGDGVHSSSHGVTLVEGWTSQYNGIDEPGGSSVGPASGYVSGNNGTMMFNSATADHNTAYGFATDTRAYMWCWGCASNYNTYGAHAQDHSLLFAYGISMVGNSIAGYSPAIDTYGNGDAYISTSFGSGVVEDLSSGNVWPDNAVEITGGTILNVEYILVDKVSGPTSLGIATPRLASVYALNGGDMDIGVLPSTATGVDDLITMLKLYQNADAAQGISMVPSLYIGTNIATIIANPALWSLQTKEGAYFGCTSASTKVYVGKDLEVADTATALYFRTAAGGDIHAIKSATPGSGNIWADGGFIGPGLTGDYNTDNGRLGLAVGFSASYQEAVRLNSSGAAFTSMCLLGPVRIGSSITDTPDALWDLHVEGANDGAAKLRAGANVLYPSEPTDGSMPVDSTIALYESSGSIYLKWRDSGSTYHTAKIT